MRPNALIAWNTYPALLAAGAFALGIAVSELADPGIEGWILLLIAGTITAAIGLLHVRRMLGLSDLILTAAALAMVAGAGGVRHLAYTSIAARHIARLGVEREVVVVGRISNPPVNTGRSARFILALDPLRGGTSGRLQVIVRNPPDRLGHCDVIRIRGELAPLPHPRNPGEFDYGAYLRRHRIFVRMFAEGEHLKHLTREQGGLSCIAQDVRDAISSRIDHYIATPDARAIVKALILGDRSTLDPEIEDRFARLGLLHLLAVSGLHVVVVGMIFYRLLRPTLMRFRFSWRNVEVVRGLLTAVLLLGYMVLTGGSASVVRAVVMALLFMVAAPMQRSTDSMNTLGAAVLVILAVRPAHLFEPGFQLTTGAVAGIIGIMPQFSRWVEAPSSRVGRELHSGTSVTVAATLGTMPIVLAHFGQLAVAGLVLNLPAVPLTTAALSSGLAAIAAGEVTATLGVTFGATTDLLARLLLLISEMGERLLGWSLISWHLDHPSSIAALILLILAVARWHCVRHRWPLLIASLALVTIHTWAGIAGGSYVPDVEILFLDVGQGDAAILTLPNGRTLLVDAGPRTRFADAGTRVVLPQLKRLGVDRIHTAVITHPDSDHLGGLPALLRELPVDRVVRSGYQHTSSLFDETNRLLDSLGIPQKTARIGDTLFVDPTVRIYVLHPDGAASPNEPNASSVVLLVRYGASAALLMGDAPVDAELEMTEAFGRMLHSDVLKVGHHGSRTSSSAAFLSRVHDGEAPISVVSVAERNRFGLPDEDVLHRLRKTGFRVRLTSKSGATWVRLDGRRATVVDW